MKINTKKIEVLEKAIQMLENGFPHKWVKLEACNCGVVVSAIGHFTPKQFDAATGGMCWTHGVEAEGRKCEITGLFVSDIQKALLEHGFTADDIKNLELLKDKKVLLKMRVDCRINQCKTENLLRYLHAWIEILKEETEPKEKVTIIRVAVPVSISAQAKESLFTAETIAQ